MSEKQNASNEIEAAERAAKWKCMKAVARKCLETQRSKEYQKAVKIIADHNKEKKEVQDFFKQEIKSNSGRRTSFYFKGVGSVSTVGKDKGRFLSATFMKKIPDTEFKKLGGVLHHIQMQNDWVPTLHDDDDDDDGDDE
jgi:hypothetical protein